MIDLHLPVREDGEILYEKPPTHHVPEASNVQLFTFIRA